MWVVCDATMSFPIIDGRWPSSKILAMQLLLLQNLSMVLVDGCCRKCIRHNYCTGTQEPVSAPEPHVPMHHNTGQSLNIAAWCLVLGAWCLVPGAWCLVLGAWCMYDCCLICQVMRKQEYKKPQLSHAAYADECTVCSKEQLDASESKFSLRPIQRVDCLFKPMHLETHSSVTRETLWVCAKRLAFGSTAS